MGRSRLRCQGGFLRELDLLGHHLREQRWVDAGEKGVREEIGQIVLPWKRRKSLSGSERPALNNIFMNFERQALAKYRELETGGRKEKKVDYRAPFRKHT